jgi:glycosyltransferase involved in cell wall biosynthesis
LTAPSYSIVIPAYNEEERLGPTLDRVLAFARDKGWDSEILVVNDGSHDGTPEIVRNYERNTGIVRLLENPGNRGKGYRLRDRLDFRHHLSADGKYLTILIRTEAGHFAKIMAGAECRSRGGENNYTRFAVTLQLTEALDHFTH